MDLTYWLAIAFGAVLSFAMSVLANLYNDRIQTARSRISVINSISRFNKLSKRLKKAIRNKKDI